MKSPYANRTRGKRKTYEHVLVVERALGKPLPDGVEIHHVDGDGHNNHPSNLVICPDRAYHQLLHYRTRAHEASGNAGWLKCVRCGKWDSPENLSGGRFYWRRFHLACERQRMRNRGLVKP